MTRIRRFVGLGVRWGVRLAAVAAVLLVAGVCLAPDRTLPPVARYLDVSDEPGPTDFVLVLNGDPETRPFAAAAWWRVGLAREVLLTHQRVSIESASVQGGAVPTELETTRRVLRDRGVPDRAVRVLPGEIASTADEAAALAAFLRAEPAVTVTVVTNGFHTRRSRGVFRRAAGSDADRIRVVGVPRERVDAGAWWRTPEGCAVYASEYAKLLYYGVRF